MSKENNAIESDAFDAKAVEKESRAVDKMGVGKFYISLHILENRPEDVMRVLARCVVTRCEMQWHRREFEYVAFSPDFEKPSGPYAVPRYIHEYLWIFHEDGRVEAKRADSIPLPAMPDVSEIPGIDG